MRTEELTCIKSYFLYKESRTFFNFFKEKHLIVEHKCMCMCMENQGVPTREVTLRLFMPDIQREFF